MQKSKSITSLTLAATAALLFSTAPFTAADAADAAKVKCEGGNGCKGKSACATTTNACSGQNSCKGKGYVMLSKADCEAAKAKVKSEKK